MGNHILGTMRKFKTKQFSIIADAIEDDCLDLSWDEDGSVARGLASGKYVNFTARVRVYFQGREVGSDYLGGCVYESLDAFMDHRECGKQNREFAREGTGGKGGSYFHDMIREAIGEARKTIEETQTVKIRKNQTPELLDKH